jgi:hypothetical protein
LTILNRPLAPGPPRSQTPSSRASRIARPRWRRTCRRGPRLRRRCCWCFRLPFPRAPRGRRPRRAEPRAAPTSPAGMLAGRSRSRDAADMAPHPGAQAQMSGAAAGRAVAAVGGVPVGDAHAAGRQVSRRFFQGASLPCQLPPAGEVHRYGRHTFHVRQHHRACQTVLLAASACNHIGVAHALARRGGECRGSRRADL